MDEFDRNGHNPTVYPDAYTARMYDKYGEPEPKEKPSDGCWNCRLYCPSYTACTKNWNNLDPLYYLPDRDDCDPTHYCSDHETDPDAVWEDWFGEEN